MEPDRLRVQFIHGLESNPQGSKARFLAEHFESLAPAMDTRDFAASVEAQARALVEFWPDVVVGSSFGGAVAVELCARGLWRGPTLLLAQAALKLGQARTLPADVPVLLVHGLRDDVVPIDDSRALAATGTPGVVELIEVDDGHRLQSLVESGALADHVRRVAQLARGAQWSPDTYQRAVAFAARAHGEQRMPGSGLPYVVHLCSVAMEVMAAARVAAFDADLAVCCALLHDCLEDTTTRAEEIEAAFGGAVLAGVQALTKDAALPKHERMTDSLARIAAAPRAVAIVKLADRITNLQPPPADWSRDKRAAYRDEARAILAALGPACAPLARRLAGKINSYARYVDEPAAGGGAE